MKPTVIDTSFFLPNQQFFTQSIGYTETLLHTHTFFEVFIVDSGDAIHLINGKKEKITQNELVFLRPGDIHTFKYEPQNSFFHTDILFTEKLFAEINNFLSCEKLNDFLNSPMPFSIKLNTSEVRIIHDYINKINMIPDNDNDKKSLILSFLTFLFSYVISINVTDNKKNGYPFWLTQLLSILNSSDSLRKSKQEIFALLDNFTYNEAYISRVFSQYTGMTITQYINQVRFSTAYTLLVSTDMSISDILEYINIDGKPYFYREFKKRYHTTPIELRKSSASNNSKD